MGVQAGCVFVWSVCEVSSITVNTRHCRLLAVEEQHGCDCGTDDGGVRNL